MDRLVLIDGNSLINRAFFALPPLTDKKGRPSQAVYGFTTMLIKAITDYKPTHIAVAFDLPEPTFRHKMYDGYKAGRKRMPDELAVQLPVLKELLSVMKICIVEQAGFEADDIIGTLAKKFEAETYILTGDRDSLQLIDDTTYVLFTRRGLTSVDCMNAAALKETTGLSPAQIVDYKAIAGDSSDNIPGVHGIGDKGAVKLLQTYGDLDGVYAHIDEISGAARQRLIEGKDSAYLSRRLAAIVCDVPLPVTLGDCALEFPFSGRTREFFRELDFRSVVKRTDLYGDYADTAAETFAQRPAPATVAFSGRAGLKETLSGCRDAIAVWFGENDVHIAFDAETEHVGSFTSDLIDGIFTFEDCAAELKDIFADKEIKKVLFDVKKVKTDMYRVCGGDVENFFDVKLAQYIDDSTVPYDKLDTVCEHYSAGVPGASALLYLKRLLEKSLEEKGMHRLFYDVEQPLIDVLIKMERAGFRLDIDNCRAYGEKYTAEIHEISAKIYRLAGHVFNINSPRQLATVLFDELGIDYPKRTSRHSTNIEVLEAIIDRHEIVPLVIRYRLLWKLNSTYVEGLSKLAGKDGVVHTEFKQMSTATGRLSSVEPNLQNIPVREDEGRMLRGLFGAAEGCTLVSADYSQIELRLLAHFSGDPIMMKAYRENADIHTRTAAEVFGIDRSLVTPEMRRKAKAVNFGIIYGMSDFGLGQSIKVSTAEAREYKARYFARFPRVKEYLDAQVERAKKHGFAITLLGRVRKIPELYSSQFAVRQFGERVAMNMPLQGSAADIIKLAMLRVDRALAGMRSRLILQVHDELIVEAADDEVEAVRTIVRDCMEHAVELNVPLTVDVSSGRNWLECK